VLRINEHFDASSGARLSPDEPCAFERKHHLVDRRRADSEILLHVGFGRRPAVQARVCVDKRPSMDGHMPANETEARVPQSPLDRLRIDEWDRLIDVSIKGVLYGIAAALPYMKQQKAGHIINVSSVAGHKVRAGGAVYAATKHPSHISKTKPQLSPMSRHERTAESDVRSESLCKSLHAKAGSVSGVYLCIHPPAPQASGRSRHAAIFPRQPTFSSPNGADVRTVRIHQTTTGCRSQYRNAR
jgi:hypothetical protein